MARQFHFIDGVAADSKGNIYTGEVETGKRIQKFVPVSGGRENLNVPRLAETTRRRLVEEACRLPR
jgi:hypothetical protein